MTMTRRQANREELIGRLLAAKDSQSETARLLLDAADSARGTALYDQIYLEAVGCRLTAKKISAFWSRLIPDTR